MTFEDFNFDEKLLDGLSSMGYTKPTPIQGQAIPMILENHDLIACAQTGTGKTAAYILPILNKVLHADHRHLNTLVIAPTRELAQQIDQQIEGFAYFLGVSSIPVYGGGDGATWDQQRKALEQGADIIIATPGRLIALLAAGTIKFDHLEHLVLDEADRMLDMGFYDDIVKIINYLPKKRQTLLFSATMPPKIRMLANKILTEPKEINIAIAKPAAGILQQAYVVHDAQKGAVLKHVLKTVPWKSVIIFASTKETVKKLDVVFQKGGLNARAFHSDLEQQEREEILRAFKNKQVNMLIGTDVLSRGIDVEGISLVINWDVPPDPEDYVHRIGRTARAETTGTAVTLINERDQRKFYSIETLIDSVIPKLPLPPEAGEGPAYEPQKKKNISGHGRGGGGGRPGGGGRRGGQGQGHGRPRGEANGNGANANANGGEKSDRRRPKRRRGGNRGGGDNRNTGNAGGNTENKGAA
ncbi:DEAD/DEAH box helicase [Dawidia soli]|uniref:DEAD/DEAH box helicase n=1 Tax=Dawidia soli TaxID=2782352 RepID=A0AAP2D4Q2_9BACT|nr:DEAD/DEAH box helicase [Dawidia soli]MBT1685291.1 DEAD/DEAH box helicase [Dawidia soli]